MPEVFQKILGCCEVIGFDPVSVMNVVEGGHRELTLFQLVSLVGKQALLLIPPLRINAQALS